MSARITPPHDSTSRSRRPSEKNARLSPEKSHERTDTIDLQEQELASLQ